MDIASRENPVLSEKEQMMACQAKFARDNLKYAQIITYLQTGKHVVGLVKNERRVVRRRAASFRWDCDRQVLYYTGHRDGQEREVIRSPEELALVLQLYHSSPTGGHRGWVATMQKISSRYYWTGMSSDIKQYIAACDRCQLSIHRKTQTPEMRPVKVEEPPDLEGVDVIESSPEPATSESSPEPATAESCFTSLSKRQGLPVTEFSACGSCSTPAKRKLYAPRSSSAPVKRRKIQQMSRAVHSLITLASDTEPNEPEQPKSMTESVSIFVEHCFRDIADKHHLAYALQVMQAAKDIREKYM